MKLSGRTVLIAGGGKLARQKLATLEPTGADVVVAAPRIDRHGLDWRGAGRLTLLTRPYGCDLLEGCALVFAATDDPAVNRRIVADAGARGILANAVDDPEFCDFYTPAVARRAGVTIAISTAGGFPGFSGVKSWSVCCPTGTARCWKNCSPCAALCATPSIRSGAGRPWAS